MDGGDTHRRLNEAAISGEFLTCIYDGGRIPGSKRRLLPIRVMADRIYAITDGDSTKRTYLIEKLRIVADDDPAPWRHETPSSRSRALRIVPAVYFDEWLYTIHPPLYPALGVLKREYVIKDQTAAARQAATARGLSREDVARVKILELDFGVMPTPALDFHEGDIFHSMHAPTLQVVAVQAFIEVHVLVGGLKPRRAYHLVDDDLALWLQRGPPYDADQLRIGPWDSYRPSLFDAIDPPPTKRR